MTVTGKWRGHPMYQRGEDWFYTDTDQPVKDNMSRPCGHCQLPATPEGHDGCLGTLKGVRNACCGHGEESSAYIQYNDGLIISGADAVKVFASLVTPEPDLFIVSKSSEGLWADGKPVPDSFKGKAGNNEYWFVRIPDIMEFVKANGQCIVSADWSGFNKIEIYDDYVE